MSRVALVYPYFRTHAPTEMLFTPLGISTLASQLKRSGIETRIFDCTFSTIEDIQTGIKEYHPDVVGIHTMVTLSRSTFRIAELIKSDLPDALLVSGGPLPTLYPGRFAQLFDVIFQGEADTSFPQFCMDYLQLGESPKRDLSKLTLTKYAGLYIDQNNLFINNPQGHHTEKEIDSFPLPFRGDFDHNTYQQAGILKDGLKTTSILTTYGCPFNCDFCSKPVFGNSFRRRSLDKVFEEIGQIHDLGYNNLWIADDNFTLDISFLKGFCKRNKGSDIQWSCLSRVTAITPEIAELMKNAGCRRVYLGLETGSDNTLQLMRKKATLKEGVQAVHCFHKAGIEVAAFFIVGYPGETVNSIEQTFKFALSLPLNEISFNVPFPLPGSSLFDRVSKLDMNMDWNTENEVTFVYNSEFDEGWLGKRIEETMQVFAEKKR
jgi:anaerobic magnesium-protoporphyrin IX monomethyl ester cyclase